MGDPPPEYSRRMGSPSLSTNKSSSAGYEATETSPLLSPAREGIVVGLEQTSKQSWHTLSYVLIAMIFLVSVADEMQQSPLERISESVICYRFYERADPSKIRIGRSAVGPGAIGGVDEMWCKTDTVQDKLASLNGYQQLFDGFPSLLLAVPFGWAADRYGRKPLLLLMLMSFVMKAGWVQIVLWVSLLHPFLCQNNLADKAAVLASFRRADDMALGLDRSYGRWLTGDISTLLRRHLGCGATGRAGFCLHADRCIRAGRKGIDTTVGSMADAFHSLDTKPVRLAVDAHQLSGLWAVRAGNAALSPSSRIALAITSANAAERDTTSATSRYVMQSTPYLHELSWSAVPSGPEPPRFPHA